MMDDSQIHRLMTQSGCGGTLTPAVRRFAQACYAAGVAAERELWERTLGAEMPADFKCWHQNAASERPEVAAWVIRNLREREALAWGEGQRAALDCRTCRHYTEKTSGCMSVVRCVQGCAYQRGGVRAYWSDK